MTIEIEVSVIRSGLGVAFNDVGKESGQDEGVVKSELRPVDIFTAKQTVQHYKRIGYEDKERMEIVRVVVV